MQTLDELVSVSEASARHHSSLTRPSSTNRFQRRKLVVILLTLVVGLCARVYRLDASGLAEDEANKIFAVRCYSHGDFAVNSEHPMLMKLFCFSSIKLCKYWNDTAGRRIGLLAPEETALRLPNAVFGALTVVPLFLLAYALFGFRVALITACLWSLGGNAIWFNRITKEDTLMVFFMLSGYAIYNSAKSRPDWDVTGQERLYGLAGAAFGLMACSKYFPHYYGLIALFYHLAGYDRRDNRPLTRRMKVIHGSAILLTFLAFNFPILLPETWMYLWKYVHGDFFTHHGYVIGSQVYPNSMARTPNGSQWFFYWLYLLVKLPPPILVAFLIGFVSLFVRRKPDRWARGHLFLRIMLILWLFPMSFVGVKFLRYTLALIPFVYMTAALGAVVVWRTGLMAFKKLERRLARVRVPYRVFGSLPAAGVLGVFVLWPSLTTLSYLPYPSLYTNCLGGGRTGYFFPHDEFYDLGARESIKYIADHAPEGALVATEIPAVLLYYLEKYGRSDIRSDIMSRPRYDFAASMPDYTIVQPGRVYFENQKEIGMIESSFDIAQSSIYRGFPATRVYPTNSRRSSH